MHDVQIGNRCQINNYSDFGGGSIVGNNVTIGAGSVAVRNIPPHSVAFGVPAKVLPLPSNKHK